MQMAYFEITKDQFKNGSLELIEGKLLHIRGPRDGDDEQLDDELHSQMS